MITVQTLNSIADVIRESLTEDQFRIVKECDNPEAILVRSADMHNQPLAPALLCIGRAGAGVNNIPVETCTQSGVAVFNTPGANANAVKELVLAALLMSSRRLYDGIAWARDLSGQGGAVPKLIEKGKSQFVGPEIKGKKLGVIGLGAIGVMVANDAHAVGMEVYGYDPFISVKSAWGLSRAINKADNLLEMAAKCDYLTVHVPLVDDTKDLVGEQFLSACKEGVRILNFARGELVNEQAMLQALESGKVSCYATDFPTDAMLKNANVIPFPHLGASTPESEDNCAVMAAQQLREYLLLGSIRNSVNLPQCEIGPIKPGDFRLTVVHKNIPNMVGQMTSIIAAAQINIDNMVNKSRNAVAYTVLDLDHELSEQTLSHVRAIDGVIRARVIK